jgi:hypothetical protein
VVFGVDADEFKRELVAYFDSLDGNADNQTVIFTDGENEEMLEIKRPVSQLAVGTVQNFLDGYTAKHPEVEVDYIHDEDSLVSLATRPGAVGFLFDGMKKEELFSAVDRDGALPRKTFSMGVAREKRYYIECRSITLA